MNSSNEQLMEVLREIPPLIPQFLRKRRVGVAAPTEIAAELGIERPLIFTMLHFDFVSGMYGEQALSLAQLRSYDAYAVRDNLPSEIAELKSRGLMEESEDGLLTLSEKAWEALKRVQLAGIEYVSKRKPLPDGVLERLADDLEEASAVEKSKQLFLTRPGSHLRGYVAGGRYRQGPLVPMVRIEQAMLELWGARDDAHVLAWQDAELEGPPFDVLSHLWSGIGSLTELSEALKYKQTPDDVESSLSWLAERELAERHGDVVKISPKGVVIREDVERETDRMFFEGWSFELDEATWMRDTLRELVAKLDIPG